MEVLGIVFVVACGLLMLALGVYGLAPSLFARLGRPAGQQLVAASQPSVADPRVDALMAEVDALRVAVEDLGRAVSSLQGEAAAGPRAPGPPGLRNAS